MKFSGNQTLLKAIEKINSDLTIMKGQIPEWEDFEPLAQKIKEIDKDINDLLVSVSECEIKIDSHTKEYNTLLSNFNQLKQYTEHTFASMINKINEIKKPREFIINQANDTGNIVGGKPLKRVYFAKQIASNNENVVLPIKANETSFLSISGGVRWDDGSFYSFGYNQGNYKVLATGRVVNGFIAIDCWGFANRYASFLIEYTDK